MFAAFIKPSAFGGFGGGGAFGGPRFQGRPTAPNNAQGQGQTQGHTVAGSSLC